MKDEFEICGMHIPYSKIKDFSIVQREYIYRPAYRAKQSSFKNLLSGNKYEFVKMIPYAAIMNDNEYKLAVKKADEKGIDKAIKKDIAVGIISTVADKFNIKELKYKKYKCINVAGRIFTTFLDDIPAVIVRDDGRITDVYKNDELYRTIGSESIAPTVLMVPALSIVADTEYIFYGNGIQLDNPLNEYNRLGNCLETYKAEKSSNKLINKIPRMLIPSLFDKSSKKDSTNVLIEDPHHVD